MDSWIGSVALEARGARIGGTQGVAGVPSVLRVQRTELIRSWLPGLPLQLAEPPNAEWFEQARRLLARCHRKGVAHNDSAKEPNWLVLADGKPGLVDFQLASCKPHRGFWFRMMAREDLRHLLKHKRTYCPHHLTEREQYILSAPSWPARLWRATGKRVYTFVTRRILGWSDREGAGDRRAPSGRPW
ncbi:MAG: serine/threonine protein kinase [Planctomycetes bacterium]|nr:serine/threonine protein kinase [Planctomycetota bacterium]